LEVRANDKNSEDCEKEWSIPEKGHCRWYCIVIIIYVDTYM
jgi:hypothetical protein